MLRLQLLLAWRNMLKRRFYSAIEIIGLSVGLACFFIVMLYVNREFSYDTMFKDHHQIYRVLNLEKTTGNRYSGGASAIGHHALKDIAQVDNVVRVFFPYRMFSSTALVRHEDLRFYEEDIIEADSNFFELFNFEFIEGNAETALQQPNSVVISEQTSKKYFGDTPAIGKLISIDDEMALQVSAVVIVPDNTHLNFDFLRPAHHDPSQLYVWQHTLAFTYLMIKNKEDIASVEKQLYNIVLKHSTDQDAEYLVNYHHQLQPLTDIHTTVLQWDIVQATSAKQVWAIFVIAVFVLVLAVVNFINLATARAAERMKETGINKILGASQRRLILQFFLEFALITLTAGVFSLVLLSVIIEAFNSAMNTSLALSDLLAFNVQVVFILVLFFTALVSGLYPAYRLSSFKPAQVIKKALTASSGQHRLHETLVVFQFVISIALLSGTLIIQRQIRFMQEADLGFDKDHIFILRMGEASPQQFQLLRNALTGHSQITKLAGASALLGGETGSTTFHPDHMPEQTPETFAKYIAVDSEFLSLIGVPLLEGRNFRNDNPHDYETAYIINETAVKQYQLKEPENTNFRRYGTNDGKIIGVMKDFHFAKMNEKINPMVLFMDSTSSYNYMFIKLQGDVTTAVKLVEEAWASIIPEYPMEGFFQDQYFQALYRQEEQIGRLTKWFSALAILLASLGLLGISSFTIVQRTKEIGIRKVVGATVPDVLVLLSRNFLKLIGMAFLISVPITLFLVNQWLGGFVVRIPITAWFFIIAGACTVGIALITISFQSLKAALANPVDALKQE